MTLEAFSGAYPFGPAHIHIRLSDGGDIDEKYAHLPPNTYITDLQGDVTAIVNGSGVSVAEYTYNAWGKLLTATGTMSATLGALNPLRYRGYVYDAETGFYYLQSRYYDPGICRFINADSRINTSAGTTGYNLFCYGGNNPINTTDPTGHAVVSRIMRKLVCSL